MGVYLIGAGGHCKVVIDILEKNSISIEGIYDDDSQKVGKLFCGYKIMANRSERFFQKKNLLVTIGNNKIRKRFFIKGLEHDCNYLNAFHPDSIINSNVKFGDGNVLIGGSVINSYARIGDNCIINTGATVGHDVIVEDHSHISPGVNLGGGSIIRKGVHVGIGASVIPEVEIGKNSIIGAGAAVVNDIPANVTAVGVPAKVVKKHNNI